MDHVLRTEPDPKNTPNARAGRQDLVQVQAPSSTKMERCMEARADPFGSLGDFNGVAPSQVLGWMRRKANLAAKSLLGALVASPDTLQAILTAQQSAAPSRRLRSRPRRPTLPVASAELFSCAGGGNWMDGGCFLGRVQY